MTNKVLVIVPYFEEPHRWMISGQKAAYELAKYQQVVVITTGHHDTIEQKNSNLKVYRLKDWFLPDPINFSIIPGYFRKLKKIVQEEKPNSCLINKHMFYTSLAIWQLKRMGLRVVVQTDTFPGINWFPRHWFVRMVMRCYALLVGNSILRKADMVVLLHEALEPVARDLGLKYKVIHNGVDIREIKNAAPPADIIKKPGETWIGYVGRLESVKGWYDLATVATNLVKQNPRLIFFFVGTITEAAKEQIKKFKQSRIKFLGLRKDVPSLLREFDIFVMPSYSEGLSNALMEAMAAGCACIASDVGGNKTLIANNKTGLLFPPGDKEELQKLLERLSANKPLRQLLGKEARRKILTDYSLERESAKLSRLITGQEE